MRINQAEARAIAEAIWHRSSDLMDPITGVQDDESTTRVILEETGRHVKSSHGLNRVMRELADM